MSLRMQADLAELRRELAVLRERVQTLEDAKPKRGRPAKAAQEANGALNA